MLQIHGANHPVSLNEDGRSTMGLHPENNLSNVNCLCVCVCVSQIRWFTVDGNSTSFSPPLSLMHRLTVYTHSEGGNVVDKHGALTWIDLTHLPSGVCHPKMKHKREPQPVGPMKQQELNCTQQ